MNEINLKDFGEGIRYLKKEASKIGKYGNVAQLSWIIPFSLYLSTQCHGGLCLAFWKIVVSFNKDWSDRLAKCSSMGNICYTDKTYLFDWDKTDQGFDVWHYTLIENIFEITGCGEYTPFDELIEKLKIKLNDKSNNPLR